MSQPVVAAKVPVVLDLKPASYWWCACGLSKKQPYCDGSHKGTGLGPQEFKLESPRKVALCQCKHTSTPPYCDGNHKNLK